MAFDKLLTFSMSLPCMWCAVLTQSCPALCSPMDNGPLGSSVSGDSPGKNTRVGCHALFQGIFPTQGLNLRLLHCRWVLYPLGHLGNPNPTPKNPNSNRAPKDPNKRESLLKGGWISLQSKGLSRVFSITTVQKHEFFSTQPSSQSNSHIHT